MLTSAARTLKRICKRFQAHGVSMDSLAAPEREKILAGLKQRWL